PRVCPATRDACAVLARNSLDGARRSGLRSAVIPIVLACVFGLALAWPLHSPPIDHHGEAREGLVVQAIVDRGEWILPRRNGELPSKPPLFHLLPPPPPPPP